MPTLGSFLIPVGVIDLIGGLVFLKLFPFPEGVSGLPILIALASGVTRAIAVAMIMRTLQTEEVSKVIPVIHTFPIFVAILAIPILGETLSYLNWIAIIITVGGAMLISTERTSNGLMIKGGKTLGYLLGASALFGIANTASKYALNYISFWNMYSITSLCLAAIFFIVFLRPKVFHEFHNIKGLKSAIPLLVWDELMALLSSILFFWAVERGPISLISAIMGARPLFVFLYAFILSRVSPVLLEWQLSGITLALRGISIVMIVGGIAIIYLV
jgi:drug/metabolite transporter (DMT)-like permease